MHDTYANAEIELHPNDKQALQKTLEYHGRSKSAWLKGESEAVKDRVIRDYKGMFANDPLIDSVSRIYLKDYTETPTADFIKSSNEKQYLQTKEKVQGE